MLARGRLADAKFIRDIQPAHAILAQVAVDLRTKVRYGVAQPIHDLETAFIRERFHDMSGQHDVNLPFDDMAVKFERLLA